MSKLDWGALAKIAFPKPTPRKRVKARKDRAELTVKQLVRAACVYRDGNCRLGDASWHACSGESEWAHLGEKKRARTRGMAPELRHTTGGSLILCTGAHRDYDAGRMTITASSSRGADGLLLFMKDGHKFVAGLWITMRITP